MPIHLPPTPVVAYIGLGANLGHPLNMLKRVVEEFQQIPGFSHCRASKFYQSAPVGCDGPDYINAAIVCHTTLSANDLLKSLMLLEEHHGRERPYASAPRTLDLDLLLYDNRSIKTSNLTVPHPRMHERAFVLKPLLDLDPNLTLEQGSVRDLLAKCSDQSIIEVVE